MSSAASETPELSSQDAAAVRRAKRRPLGIRLLMSLGMTAVALVVVVAAGALAAAAVGDAEAQTGTGLAAAWAAGLVVALAFVAVLLPRAYPPGRRSPATWVVLTLLLALLPLLILPYLAVSKSRWPDPPEEAALAAPTETRSARNAWIIAGAVLAAGAVIAAAVVVVGAGGGGSVFDASHANLTRFQVEEIIEQEQIELAKAFGVSYESLPKPTSYDQDYASNGGEVWIVEWADGTCLMAWSPSPDSDRYYTSEC